MQINSTSKANKQIWLIADAREVCSSDDPLRINKHSSSLLHQSCSDINHIQERLAHCSSGAGRGEHPPAGLRLPAQDPPPPWQGEGGRSRRASQQGETLQDLYSSKSDAHLRWMIVWRFPRVGWSAPSTSTSLAPSSSGRQSSSCPSCRRRFRDIETLSFVFSFMSFRVLLIHTFYNVQEAAKLMLLLCCWHFSCSFFQNILLKAWYICQKTTSCLTSSADVEAHFDTLRKI